MSNVGFDLLGVESAGNAGLHRDFVELARRGYDALIARKYDNSQKNCASLPDANQSIGRISDRTRDILQSIRTGHKWVLSPLSGDLVPATHVIGPFCCIFDQEPVIIGQISPEWIPNEDNFYFFPKRNFVFVPNGCNKQVIVDRLSSFLRSLTGSIESNLYPHQPGSFVLVETLAPHFGHYYWNVLTGWDEIFNAIPPASIPVPLFAWEQNRLGPRVSDLWGCRQHVQFIRGWKPALDSARERRAVPLVPASDFISERLAGLVIQACQRELPEASVAQLHQMRQTHWPVVSLSMRTGNRVWLEQVSGYVAIAQAIKNRYPRAAFIVDGMSEDTNKAWGTEALSLDEEKNAAESVFSSIKELSWCTNVVGGSIAEAIASVCFADVFVAPAGSGLVKQSWLANIPGVVISNREVLRGETHAARLVQVFNGHRERIAESIWLSPDAVTDVINATGKRWAGTDFSMDWRHVFDSICQILDHSDGQREARSRL